MERGAAPLARRLVLSTVRGPLRPVWSLAHAVAVRATAAYLRGGDDRVSMYVQRSSAIGDASPGRSDVDLGAVVDSRDEADGRAREAVERRRRRLARVPLAGRFVDLTLCESASLEDPGSSVLTFGLDGDSPGRALGADGARDEEWWLRLRPGLYAPRWDWRRVSGRERLTAAEYDAAQRRIAAWLELTVWWSWAVEAALDPRRGDSYASAKLVAEAARVWLWLSHGERLARRADVLRRALKRLPEEEASLGRAHVLLHGRGADRPLAQLLPAFVRLSSRIAQLLAAEVAEAGSTRVQLVWGGSDELVAAGAPDPALLPLVDWLAVVLPTLPDESFRLLPLDTTDPASLAAATVLPGPGPFAALRADSLLVMPQTSWGRILRALHCPVTDPVSFAVLDGRGHAEFPNAPGWSASDWGRRAVAEHRAWLASSGPRVVPPPPGADERWMGPAAPGARVVGRLLTAARAALFLASIRDGNPRLALSASALAASLDEYTGERGIAVDACGAYRSARGGAGDVAPHVVDALLRVVRRLPGYAD